MRAASIVRRLAFAAALASGLPRPSAASAASVVRLGGAEGRTAAPAQAQPLAHASLDASLTTVSLESALAPGLTAAAEPAAAPVQGAAPSIDAALAAEPAQAVPAAPEKAAAPAPPAKGDAETESVLALLEDAAPRLSAPASDHAADLSKLFDLRVALEATDPPTAAWMEARSPDAVAWARGLITAAGDRYARTENGFSRLHGWEAPYLDPAGTRDGHVISLGSGPDAFRPVRDFPLAGHFHYVDILRGWGAGPGEVIFEFIRRVQHLAAGGRVRLVDPGFVAQARGLPIERPPQDFSRHDFGEDFWRGWVESGDFRKPLVLEAESGSPRAPPRRFYLHPLDYSQPELVEELLAGIPADRLVGMLLTGAPVPDDAALALLLDRLAASSGAFVAEVFPTPRFREFLQALRSRFELRRPPREPKEHPRLNQATVFVAR